MGVKESHAFPELRPPPFLLIRSEDYHRWSVGADRSKAAGHLVGGKDADAEANMGMDAQPPVDLLPACTFPPPDSESGSAPVVYEAKV